MGIGVVLKGVVNLWQCHLGIRDPWSSNHLASLVLQKSSQDSLTFHVKYDNFPPQSRWLLSLSLRWDVFDCPCSYRFCICSWSSSAIFHYPSMSLDKFPRVASYATNLSFCGRRVPLRSVVSFTLESFPAATMNSLDLHGFTALLWLKPSEEFTLLVFSDRGWRLYIFTNEVRAS